MEEVILKAKIEFKNVAILVISTIIAIIGLIIIGGNIGYFSWNHNPDIPFLLLLNLLNLILIALPVYLFTMKFSIKRCSLQLTKDGVIGNRKYFFSSKFLQLPIEKVDNILIENRIIDKLLGGQTVTISSASGLIRFICIQNASEFVDKTLEIIKAYKESNQPADANIPTNTSGDNLEQIQKLKSMLDSGIITQDEFDAKKKQLLGL